ncbi:MAG: T9SS type A sorting domain-containing protein, partial [Bacteroidales bacterium]|nr:T9SS type A sorting domain-containing protein [Bacteroidales bacterium]
VTDNNNCTGSDTINITIEICEGITEQTENNINMYPNPAFDNITIQLSKAEIIIIYSADGRCVFNSQSSSNKHIINVSNWAKGVYYIKTSNESMQTYKFVKL